MPPRRHLLFALLLTLLSPPALADGNSLLHRCQAALRFSETGQGGRADMAYCYGLLQGISELNALYERKDPTQAYFCTDQRPLRHHEAAQLVVAYLQAHPNRLFQGESVLAVQAFRQAYPCDRS